MSYSKHPRASCFHLLLVTLLVLVSGTLITAQQFSKGREQNRKIALNNTKALAGGLVAFKNEFGAYPCEATRKALEEDGKKNLPKGNSSNAYLAQLFVSDVIDSESYFFTPGIEGIQFGDDVTDSSKTLLADGENGFAYVMALKGEPLTDIKSITPLVMASVKVPGIVPTFEEKAYKGVALCGAADGSGKFAPLNEYGNAMSEKRVHLFQTGMGSLFGDDFPVVTFPKLKKKSE